MSLLIAVHAMPLRAKPRTGAAPALTPVSCIHKLARMHVIATLYVTLDWLTLDHIRLKRKCLNIIFAV